MIFNYCKHVLMSSSWCLVVGLLVCPSVGNSIRLQTFVKKWLLEYQMEIKPTFLLTYVIVVTVVTVLTAVTVMTVVTTKLFSQQHFIIIFSRKKDFYSQKELFCKQQQKISTKNLKTQTLMKVKNSNCDQIKKNKK